MHINPTDNRSKLLTAAVLLFIAAFLAYWQVICFSNCLKWDMIDQYFPWRYHVVSCLRNGELPLWNPYNFAGYPIHADPQSGAWYMPLWVFSLFGNYTAHANAIEVFLHIWLAGIGMYLLTRRFYRDNNIAIIAGASYIGCGLLVGNAQHFTYIISACWLPFVLLYFVKTITEKGYKNPLILALYLWLFFTGGYPAFFIITAYILIAAFIFYWIKNRAETKRLLLNISLVGVVFLLLASPSIVSFALYWNDTTRSGGIPLADALFGAFRVQDLQSFFNPMLAAVKKENTGTDISMMNGYFGLIPLVFLAMVVPFYKQIARRELFILIVTIICLLAAFGDTFFIPMRTALYYLPGLNIFRFPAIFRLFAIAGFILLGSSLLKNWKENREVNNSKWLFGGVGVITLILLALTFKNVAWNNVGSDFKAFHFIWAEFPGSSAAAVLGGSLQLAFLALIVVFRNNLKALSFIAIANCIVFVQLNIKTTVVSKESPHVIEEFLAKMPQGFDVDNTRPMGDTHFDAPAPLWRNLGIFYRQPSFDGNNPFRLKNFAHAEASDSIKFFADKPILFLEDSVLNRPINLHANYVQFIPRTDTTQTITLGLNVNKYWVTGTAVKYRFNTFPTFTTYGRGSVIFLYEPPYVRLAFWVSILTLVLSLLFIGLSRKRISDN